MAEGENKINKVIEVETEYHERKGVATCCGLCGIAFSHIHRKGTLPKDFEKAELECPFCHFTPCKQATVGCMHDGEVKVEKPKPVLCGRCNKPKEKDKEKFDKEKNCKCGRPTDYDDELLKKAQAYLDSSMPSKETEEVVHSIEGLAVAINVRRKTIYEWVKQPEKREFCDIVEAILEKQANTLISKGLGAIFSGPITKLMLTKHGYRDAVDNFNREVPVDPEAKKQADEAIGEFLGEEKKKET